jgi:hypothetical protein
VKPHLARVPMATVTEMASRLCARLRDTPGGSDRRRPLEAAAEMAAAMPGSAACLMPVLMSAIEGAVAQNPPHPDGQVLHALADLPAAVVSSRGVPVCPRGLRSEHSRLPCPRFR